MTTALVGCLAGAMVAGAMADKYGKQHLFDDVVMDYFAVSLPDLQIWDGSLNQQNQVHCKYMLALGYLGLGDKSKALRYLEEVEKLDVNHLGIYSLRTLINQNRNFSLIH